MRRYFHAIVDIVRGGVHPREVAMAVCLGLLAGFVSGWNLSLAVVLLAVLMLNVPIKVFGEAWAFGAAVSWGMTPLSFAAGRWLLEQSAFGRMVGSMREQPWVVLFDLDRYTLVGGALLAALLAVPAAWITYQVTRLLQTRFTRLQAAYQQQATPTSNVLVRIACWMVFGDASQPELVPVTTRWTRPKAILLTGSILAPALAVAWTFGPHIAERGIVEGLSLANQSEVNTGKIHLSLADGVLEIHDLQVSDPSHPDRDRLRVGFVAAQLRPGPLLRGKMHVDRLLLEDVKADVARQSRARPYGLSLPSFDGFSGPESISIDGTSSVELDEYLGDWETLRSRTARLQELLRKIEALAEFNSRVSGNAPEEVAADVPLEFRQMRGLRCSFGHREPNVWIEMLGAKGLSPEFGLGNQGTVEIINLSNAPSLTNKPTLVAIKSPQAATQIVATLNLHRQQSRHELRFQSVDLQLADLVHPKTPRPPLAIEGGSLSLHGQGWADGEEFELALQLELRDFQLQVVSERNLAGLKPELWNKGLSQLQQMRADAVAYGRWSSPKLRIDTDQLVAQYKHQLRAAGEHMLVAAIDEQVARGEALLNEAVDQNLAKAEKAVDENLAKVEKSVDDNLAKAEQQIDRTVAKADDVVAKGQSQAAEVGQKAEQAAQQTTEQLTANADKVQSQLQNAAGQMQDRYGALGRALGDNVAAAKSLTEQHTSAPAVQSNDAQPAGRPSIASRWSRYGPPEVNFGGDLGAAAANVAATAAGNLANAPTGQTAPSAFPQNSLPQPSEQPMTANTTRYGGSEAPVDRYGRPMATATESGLRYPDSLRAQGAPPTEIVTAGPVAGDRAGVRLPAMVNQLPPTESATRPWPTADNRPASFDAPPPARMEMGYDVRGSQSPAPPLTAPTSEQFPAQTRFGTPANPVLPTMPREPQGGLQTSATMPSSTSIPSVAPSDSVEAPAPSGSRLGTWTRGVTGKVKGLVPWGSSGEEGEVMASDESAAASVSDQSPAAGTTSGSASADASTATPRAGTPWYQRFWR